MQAAIVFYDLADAVCVCDGPGAAAELRGEALEFASKRGNRLVVNWLCIQSVQHAQWADDWTPHSLRPQSWKLCSHRQTTR